MTIFLVATRSIARMGAKNDFFFESHTFKDFLLANKSPKMCVTSWLLCAVSWLILIGRSRKLQGHDGKWLLRPITDQKRLLGPLILPAARGQYKCFSICSCRWFLFYRQCMFNLEAGNTVQTEDFKRSRWTGATWDSLCSGRHKVWREEWCFASLIRPDKLTVMARRRNSTESLCCPCGHSAVKW